MDYFGIDPANFESPETLEGGGGHKHGHRAKHHRAEPLSFNASIMKMWRHHHAGASMGAKAMSALNGIVTDVGKQVASVAAEAAAKAKHMTISERDITMGYKAVTGSQSMLAGGEELAGGEVLAEAAAAAAAAPVEALAGGKKHRKSPKHKSPARARSAGGPSHFSVSRAERLIRMEAKGDQRVSRKASIQLAYYLQGMVGFLLQEAHAHMHAEKRKRLTTSDLRHAAEHDHKLHFMRGVHFASGGSVHSHESLRDMAEMHKKRARK